MLKLKVLMKDKIIITSFIFLIFYEFAHGQGNWNKKANYPEKRWGAIGFSINGKGYLGLGWSPYSKNDMWEYDTILNSWTKKADFPADARGSAVAFSIGNYGYVGTGRVDNPTADFYKFDPKVNKWFQLANFGGGIRTGALCFVIGNFAYVGFGYDSTEKKDFWKYDPTKDLWTKIADFPANVRSSSTSFSISGKGYIVCGYDQKLYKLTNEVWEYNPSLNSWIKKGNFPGKKRSDAGAFVICGKAYVGGGLDSVTHSLNDFWEYNNVTDNWNQIPSLPDSSRGLFPTFTIGNKGYLGTGYYQASPTKVTYLTSLWEYKPAFPCSTAFMGERLDRNNIVLFPNPFKNVLNVLIENNQAEIILYDITSRKIYNQNFVHKTSINTEQLEKGVYFYEIKVRNTLLQKGKIIKD
jgi:N-acetylneuraminic acid mutarotase